MRDDLILPAQQPSPDPALIDRFLAGECSPQECDVVRTWGGSTRGGELRADVVRDTVLAMGVAGDVDAIRKSVHERVSQRTTGKASRVLRNPGVGRQSWRSSAWLGIIASAICLTAIAIRYVPALDSLGHTRVTQSYVTHANQRAIMSLADGSRVMLAPNTVLTVNARDITLTGQAFFTVLHHDGEPFTVRTGPFTTRVLGTAFDMLYAPTAHDLRVIVVDGKVVTGAHRRETLTANMVAQFTDSTMSTMVISDVSALVAWRDGRLVFHDAPVPQVLAAVERWYGITFRTADTLLVTRHLTATIDTRRSREGILAALASSLGVQMDVMGDTITLVPRWSLNAPSQTRHSAPELFTRPLEVGR